MVDFSLTEADQRLMDVARKENEIGRKYARELDNAGEVQTRDKPTDHPSVAGTKSPDDYLAEETSPISGQHMTEAMMKMVSSSDARIRNGFDGGSFGGWIVRDYGTPEQIAAYSHLKLAIGITEPGAGSDPTNMITNAKYDPATNEYILNGEKTFISGVSYHDGVLVLMKGEPDENGKRPFCTFVVSKEWPGFIEAQPIKKMGIRHHNLSGFILDNMRVPALAKIEANFGGTMGKFNHNRPLVAASTLGLCRSMLDFTAARLGVDPDYAKQRTSRGMVEHRLIEMEALWQAAWMSVMQEKFKEEQLGETSDGYRIEASMAKAMGGKAARQITQGCIELLGPDGLSEEFLAEKWFRDARITDIYEGAGEIQRLLIARHLLGYRKGELD
ncbi:MAG: acyl-CoA dehydrogenase [Phenylobacterium sp.]|uniref:acyl-CoA dehydrogenase family protein n=1 Tax=Phenylobacterium sp. TaxID=1871053 RepID=UPI00273556C5|nr:acyl-CoA dehydrogenase [Phenylobacterium sp.]MDP3174142.1 acyl-CoA dehydrogenase [Phenylobacterium sp.]